MSALAFFVPDYRCATCGDVLRRIGDALPLPLDLRITVECTRCRRTLLVPITVPETLDISRR